MVPKKCAINDGAHKEIKMINKYKKKKADILFIKDLQIPENYSLDETGITQSLISCFLCCPRRFVLELNKYFHVSKVMSTSFGTIAHDCLDRCYSSGKRPKLKTLFKMANTFVEMNKDLYRTVDEQIMQNDIATIATVLSKYVDYYEEDFTNKRFTNVEEVFAVKFGIYLLRGKKDAKFIEINQRWLMEHKTKGQIQEDNLMKQLTFDFQNLFYLLADELETGEALNGVLYNVIRKPALKIRKNDTLKDFFDRLADDIDTRPEHYFKRFEIPYTAKDRKIFRKYLYEVLLAIHAFIIDTKKGQLIPHNPFACNMPFKCQFLDACSSGKLTGYAVKESLFTELKESI